MGGKGGARGNRALSQWIDDDGLENPLKKVTNWEEFDFAAISREELDVHQEAIRNFFMNHTRKEIAEEGFRRKINAAVVNSPADVLEDPQLRARSYWVDLEHPELDTRLTYPRHFFLCNQTENFVRQRAPLIGEDNLDIYVNELGLSGAEIKALKEAGVI
jgi:crotonobetainyl-CoA:carnitine CoA-transferase CaiB-like acyl-CoA transferase